MRIYKIMENIFLIFAGIYFIIYIFRNKFLILSTQDKTYQLQYQIDLLKNRISVLEEQIKKDN